MKLLGFDVFGDTFLGISPGQGSTAYAVVSRVAAEAEAEAEAPMLQKMSLVESGVIETKSAEKDKKRLAHIHTEMQRVVETNTPIAVGIFDLGWKAERSNNQYRIAKFVGLVTAIALEHEMDIFMLDFMPKQADQEWEVLKKTGQRLSDKRILNATYAALSCAILWQVRN